jgi:hypothetical protein
MIFLIPDNQYLPIAIKQSLTIFILISNGTITDASRIQLGNDGNRYMAIEKLINN